MHMKQEINVQNQRLLKEFYKMATSVRCAAGCKYVTKSKGL